MDTKVRQKRTGDWLTEREDERERDVARFDPGGSLSERERERGAKSHKTHTHSHTAK